MKIDLKKAWKKFVLAIEGKRTAYGMYDQDFQHIQKKIREYAKREHVECDVACIDTRFPGCCANVGLTMSPSTSPEIVRQAEDVFIAAAKERNIEVKRGDITHYVPGTVSKQSRLVMPAPKTW